MACISLLLAKAPGAAELPAPAVDFDLPAVRLEAALEIFATQSGASAGMPGRLPPLNTLAVKGRFTPLDALRHMLADSELEPVQLGPGSFRLQRRLPSRNAAPASAPPAVAVPVELDEVLITASKRRQSLLEVPLSLSVISGSELDQVAGLAGSRAALDFDSSTSSTNLGPGRNRQFIRGVADSPFAGTSQATVSIQFDEARLNYSAPDPDLRLLDVERVELLKGPQGPLYGTGALGGVFHIVPRRPDLAERSLRATAFLGDTADGSTTPGGSAVFNFPLATDRLGLRAVVYGANESGWIDNAGGRSNANNTALKGLRTALRAEGASGWAFDLQGLAQFSSTRDSQYVTDQRSLRRAGILPEPSDNDLYLGSAVLHVPMAGGELLASTSYVNHEVNGVRDASAAAPLFGAVAPLRYDDVRNYQLFSNELRVTSSEDARMPWLLGVSHLKAQSNISGKLDPAPPAGATVVDLSRTTTELALFGEADLSLRSQLKLTAGIRLARISDEDEQRGTGDPELEAEVAYTATPSLSLGWHSADRRRFAYLRLAQAERPGGLDPQGAASGSRRFHADELTNLDLGLRLQTADAALTLQSALFATHWNHVQSDYVLPNGLAGTRNIGDVRNVGIEMQLHRRFSNDYELELGGVLQHGRLESADSSLARDDARPPVVPDVRASLALSRGFNLLGWQAQLQASVDYIGATHLSFTSDVDQRLPGHVTLGSALRLTRNGYSLQLRASNLLDSRADTFGFGNSFSIHTAPQHTPLQPRTLTLQIERAW